MWPEDAEDCDKVNALIARDVEQSFECCDDFSEPPSLAVLPAMPVPAGMGGHGVHPGLQTNGLAIEAKAGFFIRSERR